MMCFVINNCIWWRHMRWSCTDAWASFEGLLNWQSTRDVLLWLPQVEEDFAMALTSNNQVNGRYCISIVTLMPMVRHVGNTVGHSLCTEAWSTASLAAVSRITLTTYTYAMHSCNENMSTPFGIITWARAAGTCRMAVLYLRVACGLVFYRCSCIWWAWSRPPWWCSSTLG